MTDRIYLQHPTRDETVVVSVGFSWPALLLGFIWALMKRLWGVALFMLVVDLALGLIGLAGITADLISLVLSIVFAIYCGMSANDWHRRALERKGYMVLPVGEKRFADHDVDVKWALHDSRSRTLPPWPAAEPIKLRIGCDLRPPASLGPHVTSKRSQTPARSSRKRARSRDSVRALPSSACPLTGSSVTPCSAARMTRASAPTSSSPISSMSRSKTKRPPSSDWPRCRIAA